MFESGPTSYLLSAREMATGAETSDASVFRAVKGGSLLIGLLRGDTPSLHP